MSEVYTIVKAAQAALYAEMEACSKTLRDIPGIGSGPMGLTPGEVKLTTEYRVANLAFQEAFERVRSFNGWFNRAFAAEIKTERRGKRK